MTRKTVYILLMLTFTAFTFASKKPLDEDEIRKIAGQMFITTFNGTTFIDSPDLAGLIDKSWAGGLLFMSNNVREREQIKQLAADIQEYARASEQPPLFLCIDEEGEYIRRLKTENGFRLFDFSAFDVGEINDPYFSAKVYAEMASDLSYAGMNFNFAPVVDIDVNLNNPIIAKYKRSYSSDPDLVAEHAGIMIDIMKKHHIMTALKHFPGHGSSVADSHKGITDITDTHENIELEPFIKLKNKADAIMIGHLLHKKIDPENPATVSGEWIQNVLQKKHGFKGLVITDDIMMRGLTEKYSLEQIIEKTVIAGNDMIILTESSKTPEAVNILTRLVVNGTISLERIENSYKKIVTVKKKRGI